MTNFNRRKFIKTSSLGAIAASTLSVNCQNNLNQSNHGKYLGGFKADPIPMPFAFQDKFQEKEYH